MKNENIMREKIISYYENTIQSLGQYHDKKEISAWAGLVFYSVFAGLISLLEIPDENQLIIISVLSFFVIFITILVYLIMKTQFKLKDMAGAYYNAAFIFLTELIQNENMSAKELKNYMKMEKSCDNETQFTHAFPKLFNEKAKKENTKGRKAQDKIRLMTYSILFTLTLLTLLVLWCKV